MPTYLYRREDGTTFEIEQRITEPALKSCPKTGQSVTRLISPGAGLVFKGTGFYVTDYARAGNNGQAKKDSASESSGAPADKSDSKESATTTSSKKSESGKSSSPGKSGKSDK